MKHESIYTYKLKGKFEQSIDLKINDEVFIPTATSDFLIKASIKAIENPGSLLDLGCGNGIVGISLFLNNVVTKLFASDLSKDAIKLAEENLLKYDIEALVKCSDKFDSWDNFKFDYIINDVSGVAEDVAKHSSWFKNVPNNSGFDGTNHVIDIIKLAKKYLNKNGKLIFPIISLSNEELILKNAKKYFDKVNELSSDKWFLPSELSEKMDILKKLKKNNAINYDEKFGKIVCSTKIYEAFS